MAQTVQTQLKDETRFPDEQVLREQLGAAYAAYEALLKLFASEQLSAGWRYYHDGKSWLCKVQKKKKTIVWMSALAGSMRATIYFSAKHIEEIYKLDISETRKQIIRDTPNTGKSKPCTFELNESEVPADFVALMKLKIQLK